MHVWFVSPIIPLRYHFGAVPRSFADFKEFMITENEEDITIKRYRTKAGLFYRKNLGLHVQRILILGVYKGREAYRGNACK